eukprot:1160917-Pelagomonas_calceolata.AAC.1
MGVHSDATGRPSSSEHAAPESGNTAQGYSPRDLLVKWGSTTSNAGLAKPSTLRLISGGNRRS